jgi:hypothetical protein
MPDKGIILPILESMPQFAPAAVVPQLVAAAALTQLNRIAVFPRAAQGDYEASTFEKGDSVTIRRARLVTAQDYDPRSGVPATSTEPGYFSATLILEKLFTGGFPVFGSDNSDSIGRYVPEYGEQIGQAIATSSDDYMYGKFRTLNLPVSGSVAYGAQPPVSIVAADSQGQLVDFNKYTLINAATVLNANNVPPANRFAILSSTAGGAFLGDSVLTEGFVAATAGSANLLLGGLAPGQFVPRYGFACTSSNAISASQQGVSDLDSGSGTQGSLAIASAVPNSAFTVADVAASTSLGAVDVTVTTTGTLQGVAAGLICKIGVDSASFAYGLILRVAGNVITLVPFSPKGTKLLAAQILPGTHQFYIPTIGSISVAYHKECLLYCTRLIAAPSDGSGAMMTTMADPRSGLVLQVIRGGYKVDQFQESQRYATLMGAMLSDHRKACLMLSL